jgi:hypothetical protein
MPRRAKSRRVPHGANPYLLEFRELPKKYKQVDGDVSNMTGPTAPRHILKVHNYFCDKYAYAIPNPAALDTVAKYSKRIVELGGGTGYWAAQLHERDVDIVVYDDWSWAKPEKLWHSVAEGDVEQALGHPDRDLLMVWPPEGDMATRAITAWPGNRVFYVGEMMRGCAEPDFFLALARGWAPVAHVELPHWYNRCDDLWVFERTDTPDPTWMQEYLAHFGVRLQLTL